MDQLIIWYDTKLWISHSSAQWLMLHCENVASFVKGKFCVLMPSVTQGTSEIPSGTSNCVLVAQQSDYERSCLWKSLQNLWLVVTEGEKIYLKHWKSKFHSVQTESADSETIEHSPSWRNE